MKIKPICPRLALTAGEPSGIGPDIVIEAIQRPFPAQLVVYADPGILTRRAALLNVPLVLEDFRAASPAVVHTPGVLPLIPIAAGKACTPGAPDPAHAAYVLETLRKACQGCLQGEFDAMVTAPIHKSVINQAGFNFTGHTEYLAELSGAATPVMMLTHGSMRVALVTTHLPLTAVSGALSRDRLAAVLRVVHHDLQKRFALPNPRLLVCGLNPHAGEGGYLGREEIEIITPVLNQLRGDGMQVTGPVAADTAFTPESLAGADVVVSMYHDQGLPVLKARGFGDIVNITLGLPIIRTSVDHGTALHLAGTGQANSSSLIAALECALAMVHREHAGAEQAHDLQEQPG